MRGRQISVAPFSLLMDQSTPFSLLKQLIQRDLRIRYRSTLFGFFWSLSKPLTITALFYLVFEKLLPVRGAMAGIPETMNYGIFLAVGIITWTFYSGAVIQGTQSYLTHSHLVSRARFWRPVIPLSDVFSQWIHYLFAQAVLLVLLFSIGAVQIGWKITWLIPLNLLDLCLAVLITYICASLQVLARDTFQLLELGIMIGFYASPIIYPATLAMGVLSIYGLDWLYLINPAAVLISLRHYVLLGIPFLSENGLPLGKGLQFLILFIEMMLLYGFAHKLNQKIDRELVDRL